MDRRPDTPVIKVAIPMSQGRISRKRSKYCYNGLVVCVSTPKGKLANHRVAAIAYMMTMALNAKVISALRQLKDVD